MPAAGSEPRQFGRYTLYDKIAAGGMGTVHLGRLEGPQGFSRIVAIKRLHPAMAGQSDLVKMFLDEARLAAHIRHPNVVPTFDTIESDDGVSIVMEYVHGESLARLIQIANENGERFDPPIACAIVAGLLYGLHAAHEATDGKGRPLRIVHRDVSPSNVLVGIDGIARVVDFGVAKASGKLYVTAEGTIMGKTAYMSPEQLSGEPVDRRCDVWAAGVVLFEVLTGRRLFDAENKPAIITRVLHGTIPTPSSCVPDLPPGLDAVTMRALAREPSDRFPDARTMCAALVDACTPAPPHQVAEWVVARVCDRLDFRAQRIAELETEVGGTVDVATTPRARPRTRRALVAGAALVLAGVLAAVAWNATSDSPAVAITPVQSAGSAVAAPEPVTPPPKPEPTPAPPAPAPEATPASATPTERTKRASRPKRTTTKRAAPAESAPACDPPYTRDAEGHKIWKRECFGKP
jgi:eukaryotic-like serine/threonine-protein kinase